MTPGLDPLSRVLGGIETQLESVIKTLAEDRMAAATYRTDIRREIKETHEDVLTVRQDVNAVTAHVNEMRPTVAALVAVRQMSVGAQRFAIWLGRSGVIIASALSAIFAVFLNRWINGR